MFLLNTILKGPKWIALYYFNSENILLQGVRTVVHTFGKI
jgi:hypothetical protein